MEHLPIKKTPQFSQNWKVFFGVVYDFNVFISVQIIS